MSLWPANNVLPNFLQPGRFLRNGMMVDGLVMRAICDFQNHVFAYRRKFLGSWRQNIVSAAAGNGTFQAWKGYAHTGHGCDYLQVAFLMLRPDGGTDPYAYATIAPAATGIVSDTSDYIRNSTIDAGATDTPNEWIWGLTDLLAADDTAYFLGIHAVDEARILAVAVWEVGINPVDDTVTGAVDPTVGNGDPVFDDKQTAVAEGLGEMLRANRSVVFSWGNYEGVGNSVVGAGWTNAIDTGLGVAAPAASSPGFVWESQYHNTYSRTDVPVVLAVYAERTAGIGGQTGEVRINDGANTITITGIIAAGWYTQAGTLPAAAATKYDIQAQCPTGGTVRVDHVCFYEYE